MPEISTPDSIKSERIGREDGIHSSLGLNYVIQRSTERRHRK